MESDDYQILDGDEAPYERAVAKLAKYNINIIAIHYDEDTSILGVDFEFQWRPRANAPAKWTKMSVPVRILNFDTLADYLVRLVQSVRARVENE